MLSFVPPAELKLYELEDFREGDRVWILVDGETIPGCVVRACFEDPPHMLVSVSSDHVIARKEIVIGSGSLDNVSKSRDKIIEKQIAYKMRLIGIKKAEIELLQKEVWHLQSIGTLPKNTPRLERGL